MILYGFLIDQFPSWKDTPSWVKYRAIDRNGTMWHFETRPDCTFGEWFMTQKGRMEYVGYTMTDMEDTWRTTLEERPDLPEGKLT